MKWKRFWWLRLILIVVFCVSIFWGNQKIIPYDFSDGNTGSSLDNLDGPQRDGHPRKELFEEGNDFMGKMEGGDLPPDLFKKKN